MPALDALRRHMDVVTRLRSVVRTMKLLAAAGVRQYEQATSALGQHERTIEMGLQIAMQSPHRPRIRPAAASSAPLGLVAFGSDQGLCGAFNDEVARRVERLARQRRRAPLAQLLVVGERCAVRLRSRNIDVADVMHLPASIAAIASLVQDIAARIEHWETSLGVGRVLLVHHRCEEARSLLAVVQLLPLDPAWLRQLAARPWPTRVIPMFHGDWRPLFHALARQHIWVTLFRAVAESQAAENVSRLRAMQAAEKNVEERLAGVQRSYFRQRQDAITEELMDVVVGSEALAIEA